MRAVFCSSTHSRTHQANSRLQVSASLCKTGHSHEKRFDAIICRRHKASSVVFKAHIQGATAARALCAAQGGTWKPCLHLLPNLFCPRRIAHSCHASQHCAVAVPWARVTPLRTSSAAVGARLLDPRFNPAHAFARWVWVK